MFRRCIALAGVSMAMAAAVASDQPALTTIRALVVSPERYADRGVRLAGRFRGRAHGSYAAAQTPGRHRWDFVLAEDDAAVWVRGYRPVGRDFDLNPASVTDSETGRWLEVTGAVRFVRPARTACARTAPCLALWIEATDMRSATPPGAGTSLILSSRPPGSQPRIVFHDPIAEETDVRLSTSVRLQFSSHMIAETFAEHVRVSYAAPDSASASAIPKFAATYHDVTRSLEIGFASPLGRFQTVRVELLEGIASADGQQLAPWTLTFTTGSN